MLFGTALRKLEDVLDKLGLELDIYNIDIVNYALRWMEYPAGDKLVTIGLERKNEDIIYISKLDKDGHIRETLTLEEYFG